MPTASPSISASVGGRGDHVGERGDGRARRHGDAHAEQRGEQRHPGRAQRAEGDHQHDQRDQHADPLGGRDLDRLVGEDLAAEVDLERRSRRQRPAASSRSSMVRVARAGRAGRRAAPGPARPGRSPRAPARLRFAERVGGDLDVVDRRAPSRPRPRPRRGGRAPARPRGDEQHLAGGAGHLGEALREDVEPVLRLGAGDRQVVLERPPRPTARAPEATRTSAARARTRLRPPDHRVAEPVEEGRHSNTLTYSIQ